MEDNMPYYFGEEGIDITHASIRFPKLLEVKLKPVQ